jgi:hypothetical protein
LARYIEAQQPSILAAQIGLISVQSSRGTQDRPERVRGNRYLPLQEH